MLFEIILSDIALAVEAIGVMIIAASLVYGLGPYVVSFIGLAARPPLVTVRARLGDGLVLSLDILIAAILLRMVPTPDQSQIMVLAVIALLRTILALTLDYELHQLPPGSRANRPNP